MRKIFYKARITKRIVSLITALILVVTLLPNMALKVHAATTFTASDWTSFQKALNDAQDGDIILLTASFAGSTTDKALPFAANGRNITITSDQSGLKRTVTQSNANVRHLNITGSGTAGITFTGDVVFDGSTGGTPATANGGGISVNSNAKLNLNNATIQNCKNTGNGGGIVGGTGSNITIIDGAITGSTSANGNGGAIYADQNTIVTLKGNTKIDSNNALDSNNKYGCGGGIGLASGSIFTISAGSNVTITNNRARTNGAAIGSYDVTLTPTINIYGGLIDGNKLNSTTGGSGGAIFSGSGTVNFTAGTISHNEAYYGGGITLNTGGKLNMSGGELAYNKSYSDGGGIYAMSSGAADTVTITAGFIHDNIAANNGGGIYTAAGSLLNISGGTISNNTAQTQNGGGIFVNNNSTINISGDAVISGNTTTGIHYGGGICLGNGSTLTLPPGNNVKIINNHSGNNGGGISTNGNLDTSTKINIYGGLIDGNTVTYGTGGGIFGGSSIVNFTAGTISNNTVYYGGGIGINTGGTINMSGGTITNNITTNGGGGIFAFSSSSSKATINITGGTISNNVVNAITSTVDTTDKGAGGGIFCGQYGTISVSNNAIIDGNKVLDTNTGNGGGIYGDIGTAITVADSTISNNFANANGGGIYGNGTSTTILKGTTQINANSAPNGNGGGVFSNTLANLTADANVTFSGNSASQTYMIKDADKASYANLIKATQFSIPTGYGYNNYDINYMGSTIYTPFTITLYASDDATNNDADNIKVYKPDWVPTTAMIRTIGTVNVDSNNVQYIMLPTTDTTPIVTKADFDAKAASVASQFKGVMHKTEAGTYLYNMYSNNDPNLNGVLDNCKLWVMATGTNTVDSSTVLAFDTHTFTNIYTPINVSYQGVTVTSGSALYAGTRVDVGGDLNAIYGIPLDLDGSVIANPAQGYDTINVIHKDLQPLWNFNPSSQGDIQPLTLNDMSYKNKVYTFNYDKNTDYWFDATFKFEDDLGNPLAPEQEVSAFIPKDDGKKSYMLGMDLYTPPSLTELLPLDYKPIGFKIDGATVVTPMSFPLKYGEITLTGDNQTVTIVYKTDQIEVTEQYDLFERDGNGDDQDQGEIRGISANKNYMERGASFNGLPPHLEGYVYMGYAIDGDEHYINSPNYVADPYSIVPTINPTSETTTIIYKYKVDTNHSRYADEDVMQIAVTGAGMDAHGQVVGTLYTKLVDVVNELYGSIFTPSPLIGADGNGNTGYVDGNGNTVLVDSNGMHWILSTNSDLYSVTPFKVTENRAIKFYYYKDTSENGIPDYIEASITLRYWDEANGQALLNDYPITEYAANESFSRVAPTIPGYIAVGVIIYKDVDPEGTPVYTVGTVKGDIGTLGTNSWIMKFLYQPDANNNGIPDNVEASITVKAVYKYLDGHTETTQTDCVGRDGDTVTISALVVNKYPDTFQYVSGMPNTTTSYTYKHDNNQTISLNFEEIKPTPNNNRGSSGGGGGGGNTENPVPVIPTAPQPSAIPTAPQPSPSTKSQGNTNRGRNNYSWASFDKPLEIFMDGDLIPLGGLIYNGPYINGYPDKTIHPDGNLTRAEAAQIIYNLYGNPDVYVNVEDNFPYKDVRQDAWYAKALAFLTQYKLIQGYPDGTFAPNKPITRAELVTLLVKYNNIGEDTANENIFKDVEYNWAKPQINAAYKDGFISGYPDDTFKPNGLATRSETVAIINKLLDRPDKWIGDDNYSDLTDNNWAYAKLMNAANGYAED